MLLPFSCRGKAGALGDRVEEMNLDTKRSTDLLQGTTIFQAGTKQSQGNEQEFVLLLGESEWQYLSASAACRVFFPSIAAARRF